MPFALPVSSQAISMMIVHPVAVMIAPVLPPA